MSEVSRVVLFDKLSSLAYKAIRATTVFCKLRSNSYVELVRWLRQILQLLDSDLHQIVRQSEIDPACLAKDLAEALDRLPHGPTSITDLSPHVEKAMRRDWVYGSLMFDESRVRTGYLVTSILKTPSLRHTLTGLSVEFAKLRVEALTERLDEYVGASSENSLSASNGFSTGAASGEISGTLVSSAMGRQETPKRSTIDLTEQVHSGKFDSIIGHGEEVRQLVDILMCHRQNNPILIGEAGVGETAVVEGLALRVVASDIPLVLRDVELCALDVGPLQVGTSAEDEFEQRLHQMAGGVQNSRKPIILFVDEAHTLVGAGGTAGADDAASPLRPAPAHDTLRTVATATRAEYKKHIKKDPALTRRFQVVQMDEPSEHRAIPVICGVTSTVEKHHQVQILDGTLEAAVRLSHHYIPVRQLPDKSASLLDTACMHIAISLHTVPAEVDDSRRRIGALETELVIIRHESAVGVATAERQRNAETLLAEERERLVALEQCWAKEKHLVDELLEIHAHLRTITETVDIGDASLGGGEAHSDEEQHQALHVRLTELQAQLSALQGGEPLTLPAMDYQAMTSVVANWAGIPVDHMAHNEINAVFNFDRHLRKRIIGQDHALRMIAKHIQTSCAGLGNPNRPIGVFMFAGTPGVGKTETVLALVEATYGGEQNVTTVNINGFQEAHTVSTFKGAPSGYIGYGRGGALTEVVRRKPYSAALLDEVEKAHSDIHGIFLQVLDKSVMEGGEDRVIDFKNTLILLITSAGTRTVASLCVDPGLIPEPEAIAKPLHEPLLKIFSPALLDRLVIIPYYPLSDDMFKTTPHLQLGRIKKRVGVIRKVPFELDEGTVDLIIPRCAETESGGWMIDMILTNTLLPDMDREFLTRMLEGKPLAGVCISSRGNQFHCDFAEAE